MTNVDLTTIEQRLSLSLPKKYRQALLAGVKVDGFDPSPYFEQDAKEILISNLELRMAPRDDAFAGARWPEKYICIGSDECGNYYSISADDPNCTVTFFDHEADAFEPQSKSLSAFFRFIADLFKRVPPRLMRAADDDEPIDVRKMMPTPDAFIARTEKLRDSVLNPITLAEWTAFVESDADLQLRGFRTMVNLFTNEEHRSSCPGLATLGSGTAQQSFEYALGRILIRRPSENALAKLEQAAKALNAKVITGW